MLIYIVIRYNNRAMREATGTVEFRALAEFRYRIRLFLNATDRVVRFEGMEPQQYQLLLALRGLPSGRVATIRELAERMQLRHHSVVELIDRLERGRLLRREPSREDRRQVLLHITQRGEKILSRLAGQRIEELRTAAPSLVRALTAVIQSPRRIASSRARPVRRKRSAA